MLSRFHAVSFDANDVESLARFWSAATGGELNADGLPYFGEVQPRNDAVPRIIVVQVPEPRMEKNRVHIEFQVPDLDSERASLEALGATFVARHEWEGHAWLVMADPEGNQFCLLEGSAE